MALTLEWDEATIAIVLRGLKHYDKQKLQPEEHVNVKRAITDIENQRRVCHD